jgi:hypothetical protein
MGSVRKEPPPASTLRMLAAIPAATRMAYGQSSFIGA